MKKSKGITLIELMVVVLIVGALAAFAVPSYSKYQIRTHRVDCQGALMTFALNMERHFAANSSYKGAAAGGDTGAPDPKIFGAQCPIDSGNKLYDLTIAEASATRFTLRATPVAGTRQAGDGYLELTSAGEKRWDKDNSGSIDAGENNWDR